MTGRGSIRPVSYTHLDVYKRQEQDIATLEKQKKALQGNVKLLKAVEKVKPDLELSLIHI